MITISTWIFILLCILLAGFSFMIAAMFACEKYTADDEKIEQLSNENKNLKTENERLKVNLIKVTKRYNMVNTNYETIVDQIKK